MNYVKLLCAATMCFAAVIALSPRADAAERLAEGRLADIMLHDGGVMLGVLVDANGRPIAQQQVLLKQGNHIVATTQSNQAGQFAVRGLRGGVYQVEAGNRHSLVRAWTAQTAPPAAAQAVQLVTRDDVVRGQLELEGGGIGWAEGLALILGTAGTTVGIIALDEAQDNGGAPPAS